MSRSQRPEIIYQGSEISVVTASAQVPHAAPEVQRETLELAMRGAMRELRAAGCRLAGGHTCTGAELALGFAVTGHAQPERLMRKSGLRPGQALVLTKPLGTGLVLRGGMQMCARGEWLEGAWVSMARSNGPAAQVLRSAGVAACTDVTGFGLLGHALEMAAASQVCVRCACVQAPIWVLCTCPAMLFTLCSSRVAARCTYSIGACQCHR